MTTPDQDGEHLRLLSIFHYVAGGLMAMFACIPILHVVIGIAFMIAPESVNHGRPIPGFPAQLFGLMFVAIGGLIILCGWTLAGLTIYSGRCLAQRKRHLLCMVVAGLNCLWVPLGTVLGVFTILVLSRPTVKPLFS